MLPVYIPPLAHQTAIFVVGFEKESYVMYCQLPQYEARLWTGGDSGGAWSRKLRLEGAATLPVRPQSHIIQTYPTWASLTPPPILSVPRLCLILKVRPGLLREHSYKHYPTFCLCEPRSLYDCGSIVLVAFHPSGSLFNNFHARTPIGGLVAKAGLEPTYHSLWDCWEAFSLFRNI